MKAKILFSLFLLCASVTSWADSYDLTKLQPMYDDAVGYGYDIVDAPAAKGCNPFFFSVKVPDGNYRVTVVLGSRKRAAETTVRAESRRLMVEKCVTRKGRTETFSLCLTPMK